MGAAAPIFIFKIRLWVVIIFLIYNLTSTSENFIFTPEDLIFVSENPIFASGDFIFPSENSYSCTNIHLCFNRTRYCDKVKFFKILKLEKSFPLQKSKFEMVTHLSFRVKDTTKEKK